MGITAELHDGTTLEFPDGTDPSVIQRTVKNTLGIKDAAPQPPRAITKDKNDPISEFFIDRLSKAPGLANAPDIQGSAFGRVVQGAADLPLGALQLGAHYSTAALMPKAVNAIDERIREINERTQQLRGPNAGFDWARAAGNVLSPVGLAAAAKVPLAATYGGKVAQGAALGAAAGATSPVETEGDFNTQKAAQIATGGVAGAVLPGLAPLVTTPIKAAYRGFVEPAINSAATRGRVYLEAAGEKADDVVKALRGAKPMVPGSNPTAGEAAVPAGSAEFSALQRQAADIAPTPYAGREAEQNAARVASIRTVGQDEAALATAEKARSAAADPLYNAARAPGNVADPIGVKRKIDDLLLRNPGNRELVTELNNIRKGLLNDQGGVRVNAEQVASVIDGIKAAKANVDNKFIAGHLNTLQNDLEKAIPGYERANTTFRKMSEPVNQMKVGQYLEKKLVPALSEEGKQRATSFANAVQDAPGTLKRSTGQARFDKLSQVLTPDQMNVVNGIQADLERGALFQDLARKGMKAAPDIGTAAGNQKVTGMFSRAVTIANEIIGRLEGKVNKKLASEIAMEMLNPAATAETLAQAQARSIKNKAAATIVEKSLRAGTTTGIGAGERK